MTEATSNYLNQEPRTEAEAKAASEKRRMIARLRKLAGNKRRDAVLDENAAWGFENADRLKAEAYAIEWALLQIDPQVEGPKQVLDQIAGE